MKKVIAECGATKSDWRLIEDGAQIRQVSAPGVNVSAMKMAAVCAVIRAVREEFSAEADSVESLHIYMAGVITPQIESELSSFFSTLYPNASQEFQSDLVAAARAACGHAPGIAAIVGTGSNSCLYDGEKIVSKVCSGGFILGDEGSAATLGRLFLSDFIKGLVPSEIAGSFASRYPSDYTSIISNVYHCERSPSGYLGSFAPFIMEHYAHPYIKELVDGNFRSFIRRSLKQHDTGRYAVGVVGGFAYALKDIFSRIAEEEGVTVSRFVKAPIEGLVDFHR